MSAQYPTFDTPKPHKYTKHWRTLPHEVSDRIRDATIVVCTIAPITAETLSPSVTPNLQCITIMATGTDNVNLEAARQRGIRVCYTPGANIDSVSEHALGLYFAARRKTVQLHNGVVLVGAENEWKQTSSMQKWLRNNGEPPLTCADETVAILGYGMLGKRVEMLCRALGMEVLRAERKGVDAREGRVTFEEALRKATVVFLTLPKSKETANLVSTTELQSMGPHTVVINVARGGILDEAAALHAVKEGKIAGIATDVLAVEPAGGAEDSPLLSEEAKTLNITVTPHLAWFSQRTLVNLGRILKETVEAYCKGEPINIVV